MAKNIPKQLQNGLVLWIDGSNNGSTWYDISGNGNHGTASGTLTPSRRLQHRTTLHPSGTNKITGTFANISGDASVCVSFNSTGTSLSQGMWLFSMGTGAGNTTSDIYLDYYNGVVYWSIWGFEFNVPLANDDKWHRACATYESATHTKRIYIDGVYIASNSTNTWNGGSNWKIGQGTWSSSPTDQFASTNTMVYNRLLSAQEAQMDYIATFIK